MAIWAQINKTSYKDTKNAYYQKIRYEEIHTIFLFVITTIMVAFGIYQDFKGRMTPTQASVGMVIFLTSWWISKKILRNCMDHNELVRLKNLETDFKYLVSALGVKGNKINSLGTKNKILVETFESRATFYGTKKMLFGEDPNQVIYNAATSEAAFAGWQILAGIDRDLLVANGAQSFAESVKKSNSHTIDKLHDRHGKVHSAMRKFLLDGHIPTSSNPLNNSAVTITVGKISMRSPAN